MEAIADSINTWAVLDDKSYTKWRCSLEISSAICYTEDIINSIPGFCFQGKEISTWKSDWD